jgi:uncharacterized membrane protein
MIPPSLAALLARNLVPKLAIAGTVVLLSVGLHWHGYTRGKAAVQAEWNVERSRLQQAVIDHQHRVRAIEREAQESVDAISLQYSAAEAERLVALAAAAADHVWMRDELARARSRAAAAAARPEVDAARLARAFDECTSESVRLQGDLGTEIIRLGGIADGLTATVIALQDYARMAQRATE